MNSETLSPTIESEVTSRMVELLSEQGELPEAMLDRLQSLAENDELAKHEQVVEAIRLIAEDFDEANKA